MGKIKKINFNNEKMKYISIVGFSIVAGYFMNMDKPDEPKTYRIQGRDIITQEDEIVSYTDWKDIGIFTSKGEEELPELSTVRYIELPSDYKVKELTNKKR